MNNKYCCALCFSILKERLAGNLLLVYIRNNYKIFMIWNIAGTNYFSNHHLLTLSSSHSIIYFILPREGKTKQNHTARKQSLWHNLFIPTKKLHVRQSHLQVFAPYHSESLLSPLFLGIGVNKFLDACMLKNLFILSTAVPLKTGLGIHSFPS